MRKVLVAAFAAVSMAMVASPASALPGNGIVTQTAPAGGPEVTLVAGGCGPFRHRNIYGLCVPYGVGYGIYRGPGWGGYGWRGGWRGGYRGGWRGGWHRGWHGGGRVHGGGRIRGGGGRIHGGGGRIHGGGHMHGGGGHGGGHRR